nr:helix-turn-helix transcriptional regulator [Pseudomonas cichorii]
MQKTFISQFLDSKKLTKRQREVAQLLICGATYQEVSEILSISTNTARRHGSCILSKLGCQSISVLTANFSSRGMNSLDLSLVLHSKLSVTELDVLTHLLNGLTSKEVARITCRSPRTVDKHRQHILVKTGMHSIKKLKAWLIKEYVNCGIS